MKSKAFNRLLHHVPELNHCQRHLLRSELDSQGDTELVCDLIEKRIEDNYRCVHCGSDHIVKNGIRSGLVRYRCRSCGKTFNALTGTPFARLRKKELWLDNASCMLSSLTIRHTAELICINPKTAFKWRHRNLLTAHDLQPEVLSGIVEAEETFFRKSQKGSRHLKRKTGPRELVSVLFLCDRSNHEADYITGLGKVPDRWLDRFLTPHLDRDSLLITDQANAFSSFCRHQHISHETIVGKSRTKRQGIYHIEHADSYLRGLKSWMERFHGVATKYLNHYLGWCHELKNLCITKPEQLFELAVNLKTPLTGT